MKSGGRWPQHEFDPRVVDWILGGTLTPKGEHLLLRSLPGVNILYSSEERRDTLGVNFVPRGHLSSGVQIYPWGPIMPPGVKLKTGRGDCCQHFN
jgi:hypothetical protein